MDTEPESGQPLATRRRQGGRGAAESRTPGRADAGTCAPVSGERLQGPPPPRGAQRAGGHKDEEVALGERKRPLRHRPSVPRPSHLPAPSPQNGGRGCKPLPSLPKKTRRGECVSVRGGSQRTLGELWSLLGGPPPPRSAGSGSSGGAGRWPAAPGPAPTQATSAGVISPPPPPSPQNPAAPLPRVPPGPGQAGGEEKGAEREEGGGRRGAGSPARPGLSRPPRLRGLPGRGASNYRRSSAALGLRVRGEEEEEGGGRGLPRPSPRRAAPGPGLLPRQPPGTRRLPGVSPGESWWGAAAPWARTLCAPPRPEAPHREPELGLRCRLGSGPPSCPARPELPPPPPPHPDGSPRRAHGAPSPLLTSLSAPLSERGGAGGWPGGEGGGAGCFPAPTSRSRGVAWGGVGWGGASGAARAGDGLRAPAPRRSDSALAAAAAAAAPGGAAARHPDRAAPGI